MKKTSQTAKAYKDIRDRIFGGTLFPGFPVTEVEIAEKLQMSRTPVREALLQLRSEGLLEYIPRKGVVVKQFNKQEILMAYAYIEAVEGKMAALLAERASVLSFEEAWACLAAMEKALAEDNADDWAYADDQLHAILRDQCDNQFIFNALKSVYGQIHYTRMWVTRAMMDKVPSTREHRAMLERIVAGDAQGARDCAEQHLRRIQSEIGRLL
jgi:DNA-binding GntR family transcriptional regulator